MKFVFSILGYHPDLTGGAWRYANGLAECLSGRGHEVQVIVPKARPELKDEEILNGVQIHRMPRSNTKNFFSAWHHDNNEMKRCLRRGMFDKESMLMNHHGYLSPGFTAWDGRFRTVAFHGPWALEFKLSKSGNSANIVKKMTLSAIAGWMHRLESKTLSHAAEIYTVSRYSAENVSRLHHLGTSPPTTVIYAGTDYKHFSPRSSQQKQELRSRLQLPESGFLFGSVRRLDRRMGLDLLIDAFGLARKSNPELRMVIAGKGPQEEELKARVRDMGLEDAVKMVGFVSDDDLPTFYSMLDMTVMPSLDLEGFGLTTIESLGCGTPVLCSSSGANPEVIGGLGQEFIFESNNVRSLAESLIDFGGGARHIPGEDACREYALSNFTWNRTASLVESSFDRLRSR